MITRADDRRSMVVAGGLAALVLAVGVVSPPASGAERRAQMPLRQLITRPGWFCTQYSFATPSIGGRPDVAAQKSRWLCTQWTFVGSAGGAPRPPAMVVGGKPP